MAADNEDSIDELLDRLETTLKDVKEEIEAQNDTSSEGDGGGGLVSMAMKLMNFHQNYTIPKTLSLLEDAIGSLRTYRQQNSALDSTTGQIAAAELLGVLDNIEEALDSGNADISDELRNRFDEVKSELEERFEDATDVPEDQSPQERTLEMMQETIENDDDLGSDGGDNGESESEEAQIEVTDPGEESEVTTESDSSDGESESTPGPSVEDELEQIKRQVDDGDDDEDGDEN